MAQTLNVQPAQMSQFSPEHMIIAEGDVWRIEICIGLILCAAVLAWKKRKTFGTIPCLLWVWIIGHALVISEWPALIYGDYTAAFQATAGQTALELILISLAVPLISRHWLRFLKYPVVYTCVAIWLHQEALMKAPSFNGALIALAFPFVATPFKWLIALTVFTHHGTTAQIMVLSTLLVYLAKHFSPRAFLAWMVLGAAGGIALSYYHSNGPLLDGADRLAHYKIYMQFWASAPWYRIVWGIGPGSFVWYSYLIDLHRQVPIDNFFFTMHSDVLQILWETGVVGLTLALATYGIALRNVWDNRALRSGMLSLGIFSLTYYPFRWFPSALLSGLILIVSLYYKNVVSRLPKTRETPTKPVLHCVTSGREKARGP